MASIDLSNQEPSCLTLTRHLRTLMMDSLVKYVGDFTTCTKNEDYWGNVKSAVLPRSYILPRKHRRSRRFNVFVLLAQVQILEFVRFLEVFIIKIIHKVDTLAG